MDGCLEAIAAPRVASTFPVLATRFPVASTAALAKAATFLRAVSANEL